MTPVDILAIIRLLFAAAPQAKDVIDTVWNGQDPTAEQLEKLAQDQKSAKARLDAAIAAAANN